MTALPPQYLAKTICSACSSLLLGHTITASVWQVWLLPAVGYIRVKTREMVGTSFLLIIERQIRGNALEGG